MSLNPEEAITSQTISFSSQQSFPSLEHSYNSSSSSCHHQCIATLRGNSSYVSGLAVVDGDSLYVASSDGLIRLWSLDKKSQSEVVSSSTVAVTNSSVKCLVATGGDGLVSSHQDGTIRVWRRHAGSGGHRLAIRAVLPTAANRLREFLLPASHVEARRRRDRRRNSWVRHVDAVTALALSPDGAVMYSVSWDRSLKAWSLPRLRCADSVAAAHDDAINAVVAAPDGRHVYTASADATVKAWRWRQEGHLSLVGVMARHGAAVNALALGGDDGRVLYSGGCDRSVVVWELEASGDGGGADDARVMVAVATLRGHKKALLCLAAAGDVVCSGSADRTVRVWRRGVEGYTCLAVLDGHGGAVKSLALVRGSEGCDRCCSCDMEESSCCGCGALVCSGSLDCDVKLWRVTVSCL